MDSDPKRWRDLRENERLKSRSGGKRAIVAIARTLLIRMRRLLLDNNPYVVGLIAKK
jgi:ABC-type branched-subunit amino acid transport system ATPase component